MRNYSQTPPYHTFRLIPTHWKMNRNNVMNNILGGICQEIRRTNFLYRNDALDEQERENRNYFCTLTL